MGKEKYLIFALARTGSTSLMNLMNVNKSVNLISEPFNRQNPFFLTNKKLKEFGQKTINNEEDLRDELDILMNKYEYNGIKHVWQPSGFPFDNIMLNQHLITLFDFVIFLNRRNILKRIVSGLISMQTKVWEVKVWKWGKDKKFVENYEFEPLELSSIEWFIKNEKFFIDKVKKELVEKGVKHYDINYEDLFEDNVQMKDKIEKCYDLFRFLGKSQEFSDEEIEKIKSSLGQDLKLNSIDTYLKIPNIQEIEDKFGSEENGYLLK